MADAADDLDEPWSRLRAAMPVARSWAYFDHAAVAPLTQAAQAQMALWASDVAENGLAHWKRWSDRVQQVRLSAARLVCAAEEEIALVHNTTEGINLVAEEFPWQPGDNVVVPADEFPSNLYPWMNLAARGVELRRVESPGPSIDLARLAAACDRHTRIVALSWVGYASGCRCDLDAAAEIAHRQGAQLFVDAIQGLGVFNLDVRRTPIDYFAADGHKWLLGPEGAGLLYVRREHLPRLRPLGVGWNSVVHAGDFANPSFTLKPTAARYEGGSSSVAGILGLGASLDLLLELGTAAIQRRLLEVTDEACRRLVESGAVLYSPREAGSASGILTFDLPGQIPLEVKHRCFQARVIVNCRAGRLRVSPHVYNNSDDLDRLVAAVEGV